MKEKVPNLNLQVTLAFDKVAYKGKDKQHLLFSLTNDSDQTLSILKWHTPFDGFKSDMFKVDCAGEQAVYLGAVYKRAAPEAEDYLTLGPGQTIEHKFEFTEVYDMPDAGNYNVQFRHHMMHAGVEEPPMLRKKYKQAASVKTVTVKANAAIFSLEGKRTSKLVDGTVSSMIPKAGGPSKKVPTFTACTAVQQTKIKDALAKAVTYAKQAGDTLKGAPVWARPTAPRYKLWFGAYQKSRYDEVKVDYDKIWDALANQQIEFENVPGETAYAYVYPTKPYKIYLGQAFWAAPLTGTDSKAGAIVHETSHFKIVAGTDDHVYGQAGCKSLAVTTPVDAVDNADSHEYFAENTPAVSMDAQPGSIFNTAALWKNLPAGFQGSFHAALNGGGKFSGKCYFFKGNQYLRYDWVKDKADTGYPKNISGNWKNLPAGFTDHIDAALNGHGAFAGKCYFFKGDSYMRYDWNADKADAGYPKKIAGNWKNLPAAFNAGIDAAINGNGPFAGNCYLFKGNMYVKYNWATDSMLPGYPLKIEENWHCLPAGFKDNFEAAVEGDKQFVNKGYFFKGNSYIRFNWEDDYAEI